MSAVTYISVGFLETPFALSRNGLGDEGIKKLSKIIAKHGVLQPLMVRKKGEHNFEIFSGERRFRAAKIAELEKLPCLLMEHFDEKSLAAALVESVNGQDLNPIEEAESYRYLTQVLGLTHAEVAQKVGKERASVSNALRLLRLPKKVQTLVVAGELSMGHARGILGLENPEISAMLAQKIVREGLSVRRVESLVRVLNNGEVIGQDRIRDLGSNKKKTPIIEAIEKKLSEMFGTKVGVKTKGDGFVLESSFTSEKDFNDFLDRLLIEL